MFRFSIVIILFCAALTTEASADGLLGGFVKSLGNATGVQPLKDLGKNMDAEHKRFKDNNQLYKDVEEGASNAVQHLTREAFVENTWPLLATAINLSRNDAIQSGVDVIPFHIRNQLEGFVSQDILDSVRYRIGGGGDLSLQVNSFKYGDAAAITLIDVVVFANYDFAEDASLWVHELQHVQQFRSWGLNDFSKRYIRDFNAVEQQARDAANGYANWLQQRIYASNNSVGLLTQQQPNNSNICYPIAGGGCYLAVYAPLGTPCWCNTAWGPAQGSIGN